MLQAYTYAEAFELENGGSLPGFSITYTTQGTLNAERNNVVWICHALTGDAQPQLWWAGLVGPGKRIDPSQHFIICANMLGSCYGSTGPLTPHPHKHTPWYHQFPQLTNRDIVAAFQLLATHLGITQISLLLGGSLGGQQALEWAISKPGTIKNMVLLATNAQHSAWGIAFNESQRMAIAADSTWQLNHSKAGREGLRVARSIALLSYRTWQLYNERQSEADNTILTHYRAAGYQQYQGHKLAERFNAYSYYRLTQAMDSHNVGRHRGGLQAALSKVNAHTLVIGITTDILFPLAEQQFLAQNIARANLVAIETPFGHDGFLVEAETISKNIALAFPKIFDSSVAQPNARNLPVE